MNGGHGRLAQMNNGEGVSLLDGVALLFLLLNSIQVLTHCVTVPAGYYMSQAFFLPNTSVFRPTGMRVLQRDTPRPVWVDPLPPPPRLHFIARGHHSAPRRGGGFNGRGGGHSSYYNSNRGGVAKRGWPGRGSFGRGNRGHYGYY